MVRSAGLIGAATMASRLLGVAREIVLARMFGASAGPAMDAFNVAFRIPNLVRDLFAEGAMTAAFVPTFTRTLGSQGRESAWRLGNLVLNALLLVTGVLVALGIVFAGPITSAIAGDEFAAVPGKLQLTTEQQHDYLLVGHTHVRSDTRQGRIRVINPGALYRASIKTVALLNLATDRLVFIEVKIK